MTKFVSQFDVVIERRGTHSSKWDEMETLYNVPQKDGISMWVADMDFRPPNCVQKALKKMIAHGVYGYYANDEQYRKSICWWMQNRHCWQVDPNSIFTTHGLVHGTAMCVEAFSNPGDGIVLFTPVYHSFFRILKASERVIVQCPLKLKNGQYFMDFENYNNMMTGNEKIIILCSPHNPGGRVWSRKELKEVANFAKQHDLILVSDEIHHDLVFPDNKHLTMPLVDDQIIERLVMMTATTKTFNIAGAHTGNVIIENPELKAIFSKRMTAMGISPNNFGMIMAEAAYSPEGAEWVDALTSYLNCNRKLFDSAINEIPGVNSMNLQGTYLAWVDFSDTQIPIEKIHNIVHKEAKIAANHGATFGLGGERFLRFNFAMPRIVLEEALERLTKALSK